MAGEAESMSSGQAAGAPIEKLYSDLTPWYHLIDPASDHADETEVFLATLQSAVDGPLATLLELGSGAGNNAAHLKQALTCTLIDPSEAMLALSRAANPECEHLAGDMRQLRLNRTFDAVLVHDSICYMTTEADLAAAAATAFVHTRQGGAAIIAPDLTLETFAEAQDVIEGRDAERAVYGAEWVWDPDPSDTHFITDYAFLLRDTGGVRVVHDRHIEGVFPQATWRRILAEAGFEVATFRRPIGDDETDEIFLCRRPVTPPPSGSRRP